MNAAELIAPQFVNRRESPALVAASGVTWTFGELDDVAGRLARHFRASGLSAGDAVLVLVPMSPVLYAIILATLRLGLVATFVTPPAGRARVSRWCAAVRPRALIGTPRAHLWASTIGTLRAMPNKLSTGVGLPGLCPWRRIAALPPWTGVVDVPEDATALLTHTSGSTAEPKLCVRTHGLLRAQHDALRDCLDLVPGMTDLCTLPLFVLMNLASGVATLLPPGDSPRRLLRHIERHRPVRLTAAPGLLERVVDYCASHGNRLYVEQIFTGGAPVFPHLINRLRAAAPTSRIVSLYGATEAEPIATIDAARIRDEDWRAMSDRGGLLAGTPVGPVRLRIMRDQWGCKVGPLTASHFDDLCVPRDEPGEIVVTGTHVIKSHGWLEDDALTKIAVGGDVWHRTGDAGRLDAEGRLWLLGRCDARPGNSDGAQYPLPVEACAMADPSVRRAALIDAHGERVLVVELGSRRQQNGVPLGKRVAWAKVDRIAVVRRIPVDRRHNAKIDYVRLESLVRSLPAGARP